MDFILIPGAAWLLLLITGHCLYVGNLARHESRRDWDLSRRHGRVRIAYLHRELRDKMFEPVDTRMQNCCCPLRRTRASESLSYVTIAFNLARPFVTHLDETSHMSAEFVFRYGPKCMGGLILPTLVLLHL